MEITSEFLEHFARFSPVDTAVYRVREGALETLFLSENIPSLLGMSRDEYLKITEKDAMDLALPQDRKGLIDALKDSIITGSDLDYYYRVFSNIKGFDWVHVDAHVSGTMEGDTIIIARFANITKEGGIYEIILNNSNRLTMVVDRNTYEVLYANDKIKERKGFKGTSILNMTCHSVLRNMPVPCKDCMEMQCDDMELHERYAYDSNSDTWSLVTWKNATWCNRDSVIIYIKDVTLEKNNEISLDRMNQMYQSAVEDAKEMLWVYDPKAGKVTYLTENPYTKMVCESIGMPEVIDNVPESLIGMIDEEFKEGFIELFDPDALDYLDKKGSVFEYSSTVNGDTNWWRITSRPIFDLNNKVKTVFCSGLNITQEKMAESNYRSLLEQLSDMKRIGISNFRLNLSQNKFVSGYSIYPELYKRLQTETADEHFAIAADEIDDIQLKHGVGKQYTCRELIKQYEKGIRHIVTEYPVRSRLRSSEGALRWVKAANYLVANPDTGDIEDITIVTDVTKQKRTEKMLGIMANEGCDYIGLVNTEMRTVEIYGGIWECEAFKDNDSLDYDQILDILINNYIDPDGREEFVKKSELSAIKAGLETDNEVLIHYDLIEVDKKRKKKQIKCKWLDEEKREILVVQDDITDAYIQEQRRMEELQDALKKAKIADSAKTEFVSRISHDIRTPINAIVSMTEFAKADIDDKDKLMEDIETISASNKFLLSLINDILDISKIDSGKVKLYPEPYPFDEYIDKLRSMFGPLCAEKQLDFQVSVERDIDAMAIVDKVRFDQITMNLLSNAVKYTPAGGKVRYTSKTKIEENGMINCCFTVSDTGIGMSKEFQRTMFDAFSQENKEYGDGHTGTGLGLAIVKKIVDIMGGNIEVDSTPGAGTAITVSMMLPRATDQQIKSMSDKVTEDDYLKNESLSGKVLLVEDNEINTEIALRLLANMGLEVVTAVNGEEAVKAFGESEEEEFSAILMDIQMPVMDGYTAAERIRKLPRRDAATTPIIAMTADAFAQSVERSQQAGMNDYVTKPIDVKDLRQKLAKHLK